MQERVFIKSVEPYRKIDLDHQVCWLEASAQAGLYVAASRGGHLSVLDERLNFRAVHNCRRPISEFALAASGAFASTISDSGTLRIHTIENGLVLKEIDDANYSACRFDHNPGRLWCVIGIGSSKIECRLLELPSMRTIADTIIQDDFGANGCHISPAPDSNTAVLWLAEGQGDSRFVWLTYGGGELKWRWDADHLSEGAYPPVFNDSGTEYLLNNGNAVHRQSYPDSRLLGTCHFNLDDQGLETALFYLDDDTALVQTTNGRLFKIHLESMSLEDEIVTIRHEPKPARDYYRSLTDDFHLCTDISYFHKLGDRIVFVVPRGEILSGPQATDSLLFCDVKQF